MNEPAIAFVDPDREGRVTHPQGGVAALLLIRRRPAPVLREEQRQLVTRGTELLGLRVQREQRGIALHTVVEPVDERLEERHAADRVVERDLTLHASSLRTRPYPPSMIRVRRSPDAGSFLADAGPFLGEREAEHNLLFGICASLLHDPSAFGRGAPYLAIAEHDSRVVAAAVRTPPHNVVLSVTDDVAAIGSLAQDAHDATGSLPGVVGPSDVATAFARAWCDLVGCAATRRMANRIYRASHVTLPSGVPGAMRAYRDDDHALAIHWLDAFVREALPDEAADESSDDMLQRRLAIRTATSASGRSTARASRWRATASGPRTASGSARCTRHRGFAAGDTPARWWAG